MDKRQVQLAVGAGLELLGEKSDIQIPARLNEGAYMLKQLLVLIASGKLGLTPVVANDDKDGAAPPVTRRPPLSKGSKK